MATQTYRELAPVTNLALDDIVSVTTNIATTPQSQSATVKNIVDIVAATPLLEMNLAEVSADPSDPPEGQAVFWLSDGAGSGSDGDVMAKTTAGGTTQISVLINRDNLTLYRAIAAMHKPADPTFPDLGAGWTPVDDYAQDVGSRRVAIDLVAGTFTMEYPGLYRLNFMATANHDDSNQGRVTNLRIYNVTAGEQEGNTLPLAIARNQSATSATLTLAFYVDATEVGQTYRVELGGGDSVTITDLFAHLLVERIDSAAADEH